MWISRIESTLQLFKAIRCQIVVLLSLPDSAFVQGAMTDMDGVFKIVTDVKQGLFKVTSVGYQTLYIKAGQKVWGFAQAGLCYEHLKNDYFNFGQRERLRVGDQGSGMDEVCSVISISAVWDS